MGEDNPPSGRSEILDTVWALSEFVRSAVRGSHHLADAAGLGRSCLDSVGRRPNMGRVQDNRRYREHLPPNNADASTFYGGGAEGYTDYPLYPDPEKSQRSGVV